MLAPTSMDKLSNDINAILEYIDKNRWIAFSKDDSPERFKAKDKLRAYGLIERHGKQSWQLTKEGYQAVELGGFHQWFKNQNKGNKRKQRVKTFFSKFWWTIVAPIIVGLILLSISEWRDKSSNNNETQNKPINANKSLKEETLDKEHSNDINVVDKSGICLQSFRPFETFGGNLIITLNNSIEYVNQEIELKLVSKTDGKSKVATGKKVGDLVEFGNYVILLSSLEKNISTYDLIIKVEIIKEDTSDNK